MGFGLEFKVFQVGVGVYGKGILVSGQGFRLGGAIGRFFRVWVKGSRLSVIRVLSMVSGFGEDVWVQGQGLELE